MDYISISVKLDGVMLDFRVNLPSSMVGLEPFELKALVQRAIGIGLNAISEDPDWAESCKRAFLQDKIRVINTIRQEYKRHDYLSPEDFFRYYRHYHKSLIQDFNIKFEEVFS